MVFDMISYLRTSLKYLKCSLGFGTICSAFRTIFSMFLSLSILASIWDAFVDRFGAKVGPNGSPNRSKTNPKTHPENHWKKLWFAVRGGACKCTGLAATPPDNPPSHGIRLMHCNSQRASASYSALSVTWLSRGDGKRKGFGCWPCCCTFSSWCSHVGHVLVRVSVSVFFLWQPLKKLR